MRWAALALLALGCSTGAPPPGHPRLDRAYLNPKGLVAIDRSTCTPSDEANIRYGAAAWHERTGGFVNLRFADFGMPFRCDNTDPDRYGHARRWPTVEISIDSGRRGSGAIRTVIHEFGHVFGLDHSPYPGDIMYTPNTGDPRISDRDVEALCEVWGC